MSPAALGVFACLAVLVIALADWLAGTRLPFSVLYGAPVAAIGWLVGWRAAAAVATAATAARLGIDLLVSGFDALTFLSALLWGAGLGLLGRGAAWARARVEEIAGLEARVNELVQIEHSFALTDPLTSLSNRRAFVNTLQRAEARGRRTGTSLAVVRIDLDGFANVNATYSRQEGDQLLRTVATSLSLTTRMGDLASRLESDEFALLLYHCAPDDALRVGQRIVDEVAELGRGYPDARVTASVGIACFAAPGPDPDEMMRLAGAALHRARQAGGNTVVAEREWSPDQLRDLRPVPHRADAPRAG
jgi:diguanylate cyclase (GGDEF)-like protein